MLDGQYRAFMYQAGLIYPGSAAGVGHAAFSRGINDQGQLAVDLDNGDLGNGLYLSSVWNSSANTWTTAKPAFGFAADLNNAGEMVGLLHFQVGSDWQNLPARFTGTGGWQSLGSLGGLDSGAEAIADDGTIVGWSYLPATTYPPAWMNWGHAFVWQPATGLRDLNRLIDPALGWELTKAADISKDGKIIVGHGYLKDRVRAFRYRQGAIDNLGVLPGGLYTYANGTNTRGDVVGVGNPDSTNTGSTHAIAFTDDLGLFDLNTAASQAQGWTLVEAWAINNKREVVGYGTRNGQQRPFRMQLPLPCGSNGKALLVVDNAAAVQAQDTLVSARLQHLGFSVELKTASAAVTADAAGKSLVFVSESVSSGHVAAKFKTVVAPVMTTEVAILDDMGMTGAAWGTQQGADSGLTSLRVADATSSLAAGFKRQRNACHRCFNVDLGQACGHGKNRDDPNSRHDKSHHFHIRSWHRHVRWHKSRRSPRGLVCGQTIQRPA